MPFAGYEDFEACVADNSDRDDPEAYCAAIKERVEAVDAEYADGEQREANALQPLYRELQDHPMDPPGPIRRAEEDDGSVRYKNILILAPGEWTDAATREPVFYSPELTQSIAEDPEERIPVKNGRRQNIINFNHEGREDQLKQVGNFDIETVQTDRHGNLYADTVFWNDTTASQDAVALMDRALKSEGQQGAGGLSVEIPFENSEETFDRERGMNKLIAGDLAGLAVATDAASSPAATANQFKDRAIALSGDEDSDMRLFSHGQTPINDSRHDGDMGSENEPNESEQEFTLSAEDGAQITIKANDMDAINEAIGGVDGVDIVDPDEENEEDEREMQGEDELEMVAGLLGEFLNENDPEAPASEFVAFVENETDADLEAVQPVLEAYLAAVDAESLEETPVSALQEFVDAQLDQEGGGEEPEAEGEETDMAGQLESFKEEMRELVAKKDERIEELEETVEAVASEPEGTKSYRETAQAESEDDAAPAPAAGPVRKRGDYISR